MPSQTDIDRAIESGRYTARLGGQPDWCPVRRALKPYWMQGFDSGRRKSRAKPKPNDPRSQPDTERVKRAGPLRLHIFEVLSRHPGLTAREICHEIDPMPNLETVKSALARSMSIGDVDARKAEKFCAYHYSLNAAGKAYLEVLRESRRKSS